MLKYPDTFDSLASMIADKVIKEISARMPEVFRKPLPSPSDSTPSEQWKKYVRGNKALSEYLGISEWTVCNLRKKGILDPAIKSLYGRIIIYDTEKAMQCLNHHKLKAGRTALR